MGIPAGKPKTIVVPVEFLSASRKVRIVTNLCVIGTKCSSVRALQTPKCSPLPCLLNPPICILRLLGNGIDPRRKQPDTFFSDHVSPVSFWNPTPGLYTRYGSVDSLLRNVDDQS